MLLQIDGTLLVIAVSFIIFTIIMQAVFYGPVLKVKQDRANYVKDNLAVAESTVQEADALKKEHDSKIQLARVEASKNIANEAVKANANKAQAVNVVNEEVSQNLEKAKEQIAREKSDARQSLKSQVLMLASSISTRILGEEIPISGITPEMVNEIIDR